MSDTIYKRLAGIGADMSNHHSDLYVRQSPEVMAVIKQAKIDKVLIVPISSFVSNIDGKRWIDIPFAFDKYWQDRGLKL